MSRSFCFPGCVLVLMILTFSACVTTWTRIETPRMNGPDGQYQVTVPACWIHAAFITDGIYISKDGPALNWIEVRHIKRDQGFPLTKVKLDGDYLITEVAEYYLAELKEKYKGGTVNHLITEPAEIDGKTGLKIHLEIINSQGLEFDVLAYGMLDDLNFYHLLYKAPRLYYFEKEREAFEGLVATFHARP